MLCSHACVHNFDSNIFLFIPLQKLKEKEEALWKAEQNVLSRDKVINKLRLNLPTGPEKDAKMSGQEESPTESHPALRVAQQTINSLQGRLNQKEEVLKKYQHLLARTRQVRFLTLY